MSILDPTTDYYQVFVDVPADDLEHWQRAREFEKAALPRINDDWEQANYPLELVARLGELGLLNDGVEVPGEVAMSPLAAGLVSMEISRIDGSMAVVIGVQSALCMRSISLLGSEEQKQQWLPDLAAARTLGAFALTEPLHGSDSVSLETTATRDGEHWVLNGEKRWIGNGVDCDMTVVWARMDDGQVGGFIVPQDTDGYSAEKITGKASLRAIDQAHITLTDCRVPAENKLPGANSFKDTSKVLEASRCGVSWSALGHGIAAYEAALAYAKQRIQFGKPLAHHQIIQQRLANMLVDVTNMALHCRRVADLDAAGNLTGHQAAMTKLHNTRAARRVVADARDLLGGSGILLENNVVRHFADMEALHTFEGTDTVQSLIIGRALTGKGAFA